MTPPIRAVIVDDEPLARERLRLLLEAAGDVTIAGMAGDGVSAVRTIVEVRPELVFLDLQMPEADGFQVVSTLLAELPAGAMPLVVFVTAYDEHALRAFAAQAVDYLVKPFGDERFAAMLAHVRRRIRQERMEALGDQLHRLLQSAAAPPGGEAPSPAPVSVQDGLAAAEHPEGRLERLVLRTGDRARVVRAEEVDWIGADGVYARVHLGRTSYLIRIAMHELESRLDPRRFVRIHRSTIVNFERVREVHEVDRGEFVVQLADGTRLKLSRSRRAQFEAALGHGL